MVHIFSMGLNYRWFLVNDYHMTVIKRRLTNSSFIVMRVNANNGASKPISPNFVIIFPFV